MCKLLISRLDRILANDATAQGQNQKFWDRQNVVTIATLGAATGVDAWATERGFQDHGWHEHNPLVPHSTAGRVTYFAGTYAAGVAGAWLLTKTGHPKLERWAFLWEMRDTTGSAVVGVWRRSALE